MIVVLTGVHNSTTPLFAQTNIFKIHFLTL